MLNSNTKDIVREFNLSVLGTLAFHDSLISILLISLAFLPSFFFGCIFVSFPVLELAYYLLVTSPIQERIKQKIHQAFPGHERIIIRSIGKHSSQAISLPFFRMICLSDDILKAILHENAEKEYAFGIIAHEIGHTYRYDRITFRWLQLALLLWYPLAIIGPILVVSTPYLSDKVTFEPRMLLYYICIFIGIKYLRDTITRVAHRREFLADLIASQIYKKSYERFIEESLDIEKKLIKYNYQIDKKNTIYHPSFEDRKKNITEVITASTLSIRAMSAQRLVAIFFFVPAITAGITNGRYNFDLITIPMAIVAALPIFSLITINTNTHVIKLLLNECALGLSAGILFVGSYVLLDNRFITLANESDQSFAPRTFQIFLIWGLIGILYLFSWIYVIYKNSHQKIENFTINSPKDGFKFWKGALTIYFIDLSFFWLGELLHSINSELYTSTVSLVRAETIGQIVFVLFIFSQGFHRFLRKIFKGEWSVWHGTTLAIFIFVFSFFFSIHVVNGLRFPIILPNYFNYSDPMSFIIESAKLLLGTLNDYIFWFFLVLITNERKLK